MARTVEFVLGLLGGLFGFFGAVIALFFGGIGAALGGEGASTIVGGSLFAILFSILGIVGAAFVKSRPRLGGWFMTISAIGGLVSVFVAYFLPFVLLIIAGLMALLKKDNSSNEEKPKRK